MPVGCLPAACALAKTRCMFPLVFRTIQHRKHAMLVVQQAIIYPTLTHVAVSTPNSFRPARRFVGLTRTSRVEDQVHAERLLTREKNTLEAVKLLTGGVGIHYIPMTSVTPVDGDFPPPCFTTKNFASISLEADGSDNRWKCDLPATLAPPATRASAMAHLAVCVKRARQTNPSENARWAPARACVFCVVSSEWGELWHRVHEQRTTRRVLLTRPKFLVMRVRCIGCAWPPVDCRLGSIPPCSG